MSNITRLAVLAVCVMACAALAVGCGGDESPSATTSAEKSDQVGRDGDELADRDGRDDRDSDRGDEASNAESAPESGKSDDSERAEGPDGADGSAGARVTTSSLSKNQYVKRANQICKKAMQNMLGEMAAYVERRSSGGKPQKVLIAEAVKATMLPALEKELAGLRALGAPEGDEERIGAILVDQEETIDEVAELESTTVKAAQDRFRDVTNEYIAYGLLSCAI